MSFCSVRRLLCTFLHSMFRSPLSRCCALCPCQHCIKSPFPNQRFIECPVPSSTTNTTLRTYLPLPPRTSLLPRGPPVHPLPPTMRSHLQMRAKRLRINPLLP